MSNSHYLTSREAREAREAILLGGLAALATALVISLLEALHFLP